MSDQQRDELFRALRDLAKCPALAGTPELQAAQAVLDRYSKPAGPDADLGVSAATAAALREVGRGAPVAPTARKYSLAPSTLFRALKRQRDAAISA